MVTDQTNIIQAIKQAEIEAAKEAKQAMAITTSEGNSGARSEQVHLHWAQIWWTHI